MVTVEGKGVPREEARGEAREAGWTALEQEVGMVREERPGVDRAAGRLDQVSKVSITFSRWAPARSSSS